MFQIVCALVLEVPSVLLDLESLHGLSPNVILACEPWGHMDHGGEGCERLSSESTGAYVHDLSLASCGHNSSIVMEEVPTAGARDEDSGICGVDFSQDCWSTDSGTGRPGSVPFVSHRPVSYGRLLLVVYVRWKTGLYDSGTQGRLAFDRWCSSGQHTYLCVCWRVSCCGVLFLQCWCLVFMQPEFWCLGLLRCHSTDVMDAPSYGSPVRTYVNNQYSMRVSNDVDCLDPKCLSSLGVVDLDLSMMCSAFRLLMWLNRLCACCRDSFPRTPVDDTGFGYFPGGLPRHCDQGSFCYRRLAVAPSVTR